MRTVLNWLRTNGLAAVAMVVALTTTTVQAGVIYDTRNVEAPYTLTTQGTSMLAFAFRTTTTEFVINEVEVKIAGSNLTGNVNVSIYDAIEGSMMTPGVQIGSDIGSINAANLTDSGSIFAFTGLTRSVNPNANYYLVFSPSNLSGGAVSFRGTTLTDGILNGSGGISGKSAGTWISFSSIYGIAYVSASSGGGSGGTVPEPTSMAIFGLGALGLAYRNRRKLMK
jgi:hypothetical protein